MYQRKVDVDILKAIKSVWADISSVSSSSEEIKALSSDEGLMLKMSANILSAAFSISTSTLHWYTDFVMYHLW